MGRYEMDQRSRTSGLMNSEAAFESIYRSLEKSGAGVSIIARSYGHLLLFTYLRYGVVHIMFIFPMPVTFYSLFNTFNLINLNRGKPVKSLLLIRQSLITDTCQFFL